MPPHPLLAALVTAATLLTSPVFAQEAAALDRIEVTGSRISYDDLLDTPAISLTKRGDYLSQSITLINDTRDAAGRRQEIHGTIDKLIARAGSTYTVLHGDTYPVILDRSNHEVELEDDGKRPDVSRVELQVKVALDDASVDGAKQIHALRRFVQDTPKVGRTEIDLSDETALGMNKPERYRYELIAAIAADSHRVGGSIGAGCRIDLEDSTAGSSGSGWGRWSCCCMCGMG